MRLPRCRRRTRGISLGLLALWVTAARCLQSKYLTRGNLAGASDKAGGNNVAGRGHPSCAAVIRARVTSPSSRLAGGERLESQGSLRCPGPLPLLLLEQETGDNSLPTGSCQLATNFYFLSGNNETANPKGAHR